MIWAMRWCATASPRRCWTSSALPCDILTVRKVAADLKATGAHNATAGRARGLTGPRKFAAMQAAYEQFRQDGRLPATYEVVFAHAWVPAQAARRAARRANQRLPGRNQAGIALPGAGK